MKENDIKNILPILTIENNKKYLKLIEELLKKEKIEYINFDKENSIKIETEDKENYKIFLKIFTPKYQEENSLLTYFSNPFINDNDKFYLIKLLNNKIINLNNNPLKTLLEIIIKNNLNLKIFFNNDSNYSKLNNKYNKKIFLEIDEEIILNKKIEAFCYYINKNFYKNNEKNFNILILIIDSFINIYKKKFLTNISNKKIEYLSDILRNEFIFNLKNKQKEELKNKIIQLSSFYNLQEKKLILSALYSHIKIDKITNLPLNIKPEYLINSINSNNPKYMKRFINNKNNRIKLLNEMKYLEDYFNNFSRTENFIVNYLEKFKTSNYNLFKIFEENNNLIKGYPKEIDFLFKKENFSIKEFYIEIKKLIKNYEFSKDNKILLKISIILTLAFENVNFMNEIFQKSIKLEDKKERILYKKIYNEIIQGIKYFQSIKEENSYMYSDNHVLRFDFNINDFLKMNENFQEKYVFNIIELIQFSNNERTEGYQNLFKIIEKNKIAKKLFKDSLYIKKTPNEKGKTKKILKSSKRFFQLESLSIYSKIIDKLQNQEVLSKEDKKKFLSLEKINVINNIELY